MAITKVVDEQGNILHDCIEAGCDTSWDNKDRSKDKTEKEQVLKRED